MKDKIALVTGAAGGIGAAVAGALGELGTTVAAVDADADRLRETAEKLSADGLHVVPFTADVSNGREVASLVDAVEDRLGPPDFLVNAAGVLRLGTVGELTEEDWASTFAVNATGVFLLSQAVVGRMIARSPPRRHRHRRLQRGGHRPDGDGRLLRRPRRRRPCSPSASAWRSHSTASGATSSRPAPPTPRCSASMWHDETGPAQDARRVRPDAYRVGIPLGKLATPSDIADAVVFLLSDRASHITMHTLTVDGGATLGV